MDQFNEINESGFASTSIQDATQLHGIIVVFAKCPIAGSSKTRLTRDGFMNSDEAADLAEAMLKDVIQSISEHNLLKTCKKVLVYAPGNEQGEYQMTQIMDALGLRAIPTALEESSPNEDVTWYLLPMASSTGTFQKSLLSSDLGFKLATALEQIRDWNLNFDNHFRDSLINNQQKYTRPIMFLGMDSPDLPCDELAEAMLISKEQSKAYLNPALDGGYSALTLPVNAPPKIFEGIRWSCSLTAISQLKALSDYGIDTVLGSVMNDIDETCDVENLAKRLCYLYSPRNGYSDTFKNDDNLDVLSRKSRRIRESASIDGEKSRSSMSLPCANTFQTLLKVKLIQQVKDGGPNMYYYRTVGKNPH
jgi:glycosyltransferase A (GT-A) superfamily protein (DUF2064 family)